MFKTCPSCGTEVPQAAVRCKSCFHDFTEVKKSGGSPLMLLGAAAVIVMIFAGTFYAVSQRPLESHTLVDEASQSIIWTTRFRDKTATDRVSFNDVIRLEYSVNDEGDFEIVALTTDAERKVIAVSEGRPILQKAQQYSDMIGKPLEIVESASGLRSVQQ